MVTKVIYWWDRLTRQWIIQAKDAEGNQIGNADYAPNRRTLPSVLKAMIEKYPNLDLVPMHSKSADD